MPLAINGKLGVVVPRGRKYNFAPDKTVLQEGRFQSAQVNRSVTLPMINRSCPAGGRRSLQIDQASQARHSGKVGKPEEGENVVIQSATSPGFESSEY
jgi:hypothetical protein